jgi:molecular chaperone GrpE (heat shock protein)
MLYEHLFDFPRGVFPIIIREAQPDILNKKVNRPAKINTYKIELDNDTERFVIELLSIVDDLENAEKYQETGTAVIKHKLLSILERYGVKSYAKKGDVFNSDIHEAIGYEEHDFYPKPIVGEVFRQGYKLNDKIIRYAQVFIIK